MRNKETSLPGGTKLVAHPVRAGLPGYVPANLEADAVAFIRPPLEEKE